MADKTQDQIDREKADRLKHAMVGATVAKILKAKQDKERKHRERYRWFYMAKDLAQRTRWRGIMFVRAQSFRWVVKKILWEYPSLNAHARIIIELRPNVLGILLGYQKQLKGFYGHPGYWSRILGQVQDGPIPLGFQRKLSFIYNVEQMHKTRPNL